jgi:hypothetical protein
MSALLLIVGLAGQCLLGLWLADRLLVRARKCPQTDDTECNPEPVERWGLGMALGTAAVSWLLFLWSLCGGPLGPGISWVLTAFGWLTGGTTLLKGRRSRAVQPTVAPAASDDEAALARCCRVVIGVLLALVVAQTLQTPQRFWDERAIFAIKGKVLLLERSVHSPLLAHPDFVQGHPRYPLLIPLAEAHIYALLGRVDDRWSKAIFPLLFSGLVLSYAGVLSRHCGVGRGWLLALMVATVPVLFPFELGFLSGQGDAPLASYHGLAVLYAWDALQRAPRAASAQSDWRPWLLVGGLGAAAAFTKDEGIAYLMVGSVALAGAWCAASFRRQDGGIRLCDLPAVLTALGATASLILGPWFWHRRGLPTTTEMNYFGRLSVALLVEQRERLRWIVPHLVSRMFTEWRAWGLQWWVLLAALLSAPRRALRPGQVFVLLEVVGAIAALIVAGMIAPIDVQDHIGGSSERFLMQIAPLAILFAAGQWGARAQSSAK